MKRFPSERLLEALRAVDAELSGEIEIVVIGGAAISLAHSAHKHVTADIDILPIKAAKFWAVCERISRTGGVPISATTIATEPENLADRLERVPDDRLRHIRILVPERHDLALMKIARGSQHDLDSLEEVHQAKAFDLETLLERYEETAPNHLGSSLEFDQAFLSLISRCFEAGDLRATEAALKRLRGKWKKLGL